MKRERNLIALMLATMMLLMSFFAGCGNATTSTSTASTTPAASTTSAATTTPAASAEVTQSAGNSESPPPTPNGEVTKITYFSGGAGPKVGNDNFAYKLMLEELNIDMEGVWISTPSSQALAAMIASGEMPDVVFQGTGNRAIFQEFIDSGMVLAWDDYIQQMPDYNNYVGPSILDYWRDANDGKLYMLPGFVYDPSAPLSENLRADPHAFGVRSDILKLTGRTTLPESIDDFYKMLVDSNKLVDRTNPLYKDFVPMALEWDAGKNTWTMDIWAHLFGASPGFWLPDDEKQILKPLWLQDGWRDSMVFFAKLYREGLIDPEILTLGQAEIQAKAMQGKYGVYVAHITAFNDNIDGALKAMNFPGEYAAGRFPRVNPGKPANWYQKTTLGGSIAMISKKAKNVDKIIELTNWQNTKIGNCSTWWGGPDKVDSWWYLSDDKKDIVYNKPFMDGLAKGTKVTDKCGIWTYWIAGPGVNDICQLYTNVIDSPGFSPFFGDMRKYGYEDLYTDVKQDKFEYADKGMQHKALWPDLETIMRTYRGDIIMRTASDEEAIAKYNEMVKALMDAGLNELMKEDYQLWQKVNK